MIQGQSRLCGRQQRISQFNGSLLLQRHPVLTPILLISGSVLFSIASFFADALFPILTFVGVPSALLCLSIAFVLGVAGVLAGIIGIFECLNRYSLQAKVFPKPKEHNYANRN